MEVGAGGAGREGKEGWGGGKRRVREVSGLLLATSCTEYFQIHNLYIFKSCTHISSQG